jgi:hypothetical protein
MRFARAIVVDDPVTITTRACRIGTIGLLINVLSCVRNLNYCATTSRREHMSPHFCRTAVGISVLWCTVSNVRAVY